MSTSYNNVVQNKTIKSSKLPPPYIEPNNSSSSTDNTSHHISFYNHINALFFAFFSLSFNMTFHAHKIQPEENESFCKTSKYVKPKN